MFYCHFFGHTESIVNLLGAETHWQDRLEPTFGVLLQKVTEDSVFIPVFSVGFSPEQVHYGFSVTKEMTVEHSWGERVIPNFISMVAGQSLESHSLRASLHAASWSLPLGPSARPSSEPLCLHSHPLGLCPQCCHHFSLCSDLLQPCSCATMSHRALGRALYIES